MQYSNFIPDFCQDTQYIATAMGFCVQAHIKQRELDLTQSLQATLKVFRGQHLVKQRAGQGFARVHMRGHVTQDRPFPAKVFHELAGQLNRIPFHATDARHITLIDLREHVVQAVAAFVKKGDDVIMGQQRRLAVDAFGEIAHQVSNRGLQQACVWA